MSSMCEAKDRLTHDDGDGFTFGDVAAGVKVS